MENSKKREKYAILMSKLKKATDNEYYYIYNLLSTVIFYKFIVLLSQHQQCHQNSYLSVFSLVL